MATKKQSSANESGRSSGSAGILVGAAIAGAAIGLAANVGRKLFVQFTSGATGNWSEALATEHKMTLAVFDKIEATENSQTMMRAHLLAKLKNALTKHALQEENVIYPALREAGEKVEADHLTADHGYVKTYLYELEAMEKDDPSWLSRVAEFRTMIEQHMREEENEIFPRFRAMLPEHKDRELTAMMNKEGFKFA